MTELEAETWAERLKRVWAAKTTTTARWQFNDRFIFRCRCRGKYFIYSDKSHWPFELTTYRGLSSPCFLGCNEQGEIYFGGLKSHNRASLKFRDESMDLFRRNCWLSGCPIEASAHEKAEWMQGFSREELEAWNLKM